MTQNDPHDALIILRYVSWGKFSLEKNLRGARAESSLELLDWPLWTGLSQVSISQTPPPPSGDSCDPPPPPPDAGQFCPCLGEADPPTGTRASTNGPQGNFAVLRRASGPTWGATQFSKGCKGGKTQNQTQRKACPDTRRRWAQHHRFPGGHVATPPPHISAFCPFHRHTRHCQMAQPLSTDIETIMWQGVPQQTEGQRRQEASFGVLRRLPRCAKPLLQRFCASLR